MFLTLNEIRSALLLDPLDKDVPFLGISTDTRTIKPGSLFVALRGENFDGHDYVQKAFALGAAAAIVDHVMPDSDGQFIVVPDSLAAYGKVASYWRNRFAIPIVAVTGSVGKTTMKEMIGLTLLPLGKVVKSEKNENNEVGVPQTLLRLNADSKAGVIEMGMRGFGQIKYLADIVDPTVGVITMIGESHIELVGTRQGIADAKGELLVSLSNGATAVLNADDQFYGHLAEKTAEKMISFGAAESATVRVVGQAQTDDGWSFSLQIDGVMYPVNLRSPAKHDTINAAGAVATAIAVGVSAGDAIQALESYRPAHMRMEVIASKSGAVILSDCYNAAPSSVKSALQTLASFQRSGTKSAFLGDMRELGDYAEAMHNEVAAEASDLSLTNVYPVGTSMRQAFPTSSEAFANSDEAASFVRGSLALSADDVVLVKGSRAMLLEKVVEALVNL